MNDLEQMLVDVEAADVGAVALKRIGNVALVALKVEGPSAAAWAEESWRSVFPGRQFATGSVPPLARNGKKQKRSKRQRDASKRKRLAKAKQPA